MPASAGGIVRLLGSELQATGKALEPLGPGFQVRDEILLDPLVAGKRIETARALLPEVLLEAGEPALRIVEAVGHEDAGHDHQALIADLAERAAELVDGAIEAGAELHDMVLLAVLAGHAVDPPVHGEVDLRHLYCLSVSLCSTARIVSTAWPTRFDTSRVRFSSFTTRAWLWSRLSASPARSAASISTSEDRPAAPSLCDRRSWTAISRLCSAASNRLIAASAADAIAAKASRAHPPARCSRLLCPQPAAGSSAWLVKITQRLKRRAIHRCNVGSRVGGPAELTRRGKLVLLRPQSGWRY